MYKAIFIVCSIIYKSILMYTPENIYATMYGEIYDRNIDRDVSFSVLHIHT